MDKLFGNLHRVLLVGLILAIVVAVILHSDQLGTHAFWAFVVRWIHVWFGILWIGLLYYFNFVQTPAFTEVSDGTRSEAMRTITWRALWWFRFGALLTFLTGILILGFQKQLGELADEASRRNGSRSTRR